LNGSTGAATFSSSVTATGNAATNASVIFNNPSGASGTAQWYGDFTAGATVIGRIFRGNGASGVVANGLNIDNFGGFQVRVNQLGGSGDSINLLGGNVGIGTTSPKAKAEFASGLPTSIPTHTDRTNGIVVTDGGAIYGRLGVSNRSSFGAGYPTYLQAGDFDGALYYNLLLNPLGGNVGIGTTSPAQLLDVRSANTSGASGATIRVGSQNHGGDGHEFGNLEFYWGDPDSEGVKAKIYAKNVGNVGPGGGGAADLLFATTPAFGSSTERMRITSTGIACFACQICVPSVISCLNVNSGFTALLICNPNPGSSAFSQISIFNNTSNQAGLFYNSSTRSDDGGVCSFSMYNDSANGNIRIRTGNNIILATGAPATDRLTITSAGAVIQNTVNGRLSKTGSTSITFTLTIASIAAWTPGYATIRVSGTRGGLQEQYAAMYFLRLVYFQGSVSPVVNNVSGDTGSASVSVTASFPSGNTILTITISDGGASTDYLIADIDASSFTNIISIT
jgi:hypothetical protein